MWNKVAGDNVKQNASSLFLAESRVCKAILLAGTCTGLTLFHTYTAGAPRQRIAVITYEALWLSHDCGEK